MTHSESDYDDTCNIIVGLVDNQMRYCTDHINDLKGFTSEQSFRYLAYLSGLLTWYQEKHVIANTS